MLRTVEETARALRMERHRVYYLLRMGYIEAVKVGRVWRLAPEAAEEYAERCPERADRNAAGHFVYPGDGGFLFGTLPDRIPPDPLGAAAGVERRRRRLVRRAGRSQEILLPELQPVTQLPLFTA